MAVTTATRKPKKSNGASPGGNSTGDVDSSNASRGGRGLSGFYAAGPAVLLAAPVQAKVKVGKAGDPFEREADHVADKVTSGEKAPGISRIPAGGLGSQRQPEETQEAQKQEDEAQESHEEKAQQQEEEPAQEQGEEKKAQQQEEEAQEQEEEAQEFSLQRAGEEEETQQQEEEAQEKEDEKAQPQEEEAQEKEEEEAQSQEEETQEQEEEEAQSKEDETQEQGEEESQSQEEEEAQEQGEEEEAQSQEEEEAQEQGEEEKTQPQEEEAQEQEEEEAQSQDEEAQEQEEEAQEMSLQRKEEETQEQEEEAQELSAQRKEDDQAQESGKEEQAQEKSAEPPAANRESKEEVASKAIHSRGAGEPLDGGVRQKLETGMGTDLSDVRVHTDTRAEQAAKAMKARAFTHKQHIWLAKGESKTDEKLMAHETTHSLQQGAIVRRQPQAPAGAEVDRKPPEREPAAPQSASREASTEPAGGPKPQGSAKDPVAATAAAVTPRPERGEKAPASAGAPVGAGGPMPEAATSLAGPTRPEEPETAAAAEPPPGKEAPPAEGEPGKGKSAKKAAKASAKEEGAAPAAGGKDGRFQGVVKRLQNSATQEKAHEPAVKKVGDAQAAAVAPPNDRSSRAQANQVNTMSQAEAEKPNKESFLELLRAKLESIAPKNMEETKEFKENGKAGKLKESLTGNVQQQKADSEKQIKQTTKTKPDPKSVEAKPFTEMPAEPADPKQANLQAEKVLPLPKSEEEISLEANTKSADDLMAENDIDDEQLERANEPQFTEALEAKKELKAHSEESPKAYREEETAYVDKEKAEIKGEASAAKQEMRRQRSTGAKAVKAKQSETQKKEELERKRVADEIEKLYEKTRKKVEDKLESLDGEVNRKFDEGEASARQRFEDDVDAKMAHYKWERYDDRIGGGLLWLKDKIFGMPDEVNEFYEQSRDQYIKDMDAVLVDIADTVDKTLADAKKDIADGKKDIQKYVDALPKDLKKAGEEASEKVSDRFDQLEQGVENKKQQLAQQMAQKYQQARDKLDERIEELKAANQGLLDKFIGFIKKIIEILRKLKEFVVSILKSAGDVIRGIIKDPGGFLGNMLGAVKKGFNQFQDNFGEHLKKGMVSWLFGTLSDAGVQVPKDFSPSSIFGVVLQVMGLTKDAMRARLSTVIGPGNVGRLEAAWEVVSTLMAEGPGGLWAKAQEFLGDLKETIMSQVQEWLITQIIKQAVIWVVSLFNPVAGIIKVIKMIIDVVMFFVENIERIAQLVKAITQSVDDIVAGKVESAANYVEKVMGRMIPLMIAFLAKILGIGGIAAKIHSVIKSLQRRVEKAIDKVLKKIAAGVKKVFGKGKAAYKKGKAAVKKGVQKVKEFLFPPKPFKAEGNTHTLMLEKQGNGALLVIAASPGTEVQQYVWKFRARIDTKFPGKSNPTAEKLYSDAKKQAMVSAKTLAVVFAAANPSAPAKSKLQKNTAQLIATIVALWKELGTPIMLPGEGEVNYHGSLPTRKMQQRHHMPQDAVMKRLSLWIKTYFLRAGKDQKEVSRRESVLSARGVKYSKAGNYKKDDGVSMLMANVRHSQTRSFASLPQPLNIPYYTGPSSVKGKQAADKQVSKFVSQVADEFRDDRQDVVAIYEGRKGLPPVGKKSQAKIPGAVSKVKSLNSSRFGAFLK